MYRLFVAIDPSPKILSNLQDICYGLPLAKWADESQMHITLRFIGEVDGAEFRNIREELMSVKAAPFDLTIKGVGVFPPRNHPETLWAGIDQCEGLTLLRGRVETSLAKAGVGRDSRKFAPHIGLARLKGAPDPQIAAFLSAHALFRMEPFIVDQFYLYSSFLSSERALHQIEASYPLI